MARRYEYGGPTINSGFVRQRNGAGKILRERIYGPIPAATLAANYWGTHHTNQGIDQRRIDQHYVNYTKPRPAAYWTWHDEEDNCPIYDPPGENS